jgi:hypothetical protein
MSKGNPSPTNIGTVTPVSSSARLGDSLTARLGEVLSQALADVSVLEVRTYTSNADDAVLAKVGDPIEENTRLRAFTRVSMDGDTSVCLPLLASGEPDEALWKLHNEIVKQARADRAATVSTAISLLASLTGR